MADVVYAVVDHVPAGLEGSSLTSVIFYYANWKIVTTHTFPLIAPGLAHLWSLSVEEQFYIIWPLLLVLFLNLRRNLLTVVRLTGGAILTVAITRATLLPHTVPGLLYFRTDIRADSLLIGALAAQLWGRARIPQRALIPAAYVGLVFVAICVARLPYQSRFLFNGGFTMSAVAVAVMLLAIVGTPWLPKRVLSLRPLRAIGRVSYGLYLWHSSCSTSWRNTADIGTRTDESSLA